VRRETRLTMNGSRVILFTVNSVSPANVISRPPEVAGFPALNRKDTTCSRLYLFRFLLHRSSLDQQ
jgi:hypothetical protein